MYKLELHKHLAERWHNFSICRQLLMIINELQRAGNWIKRQDQEEAMRAYERAFELVDLTVDSAKHSNFVKELLRWRELLAAAYIDKNYKEVRNNELLSILLTLNHEAYQTFHSMS